MDMADRRALFGPAGNSASFTAQYSASVHAPQWLYDLGLDTYEYQCGKGVHVGQATAETIGQAASEHGINLTIHGPYYISLTNPDKLEGNIGYVLQSCRAAKWMGANRIVVHAGSTTGRERADALKDASFALEKILEAMDENGYGDIAICPETMGKINQLGSFEEIMEICRMNERLIPCIDFGHIYARTLGLVEGYEQTKQLFDLMEDMIGLERAKSFHSHFSKIEYSKGGEKKHLTFENQEFGPDFRPVARLVAERGYHPVFVCESSGTQAEDALEMKHIYYEELERVL